MSTVERVNQLVHTIFGPKFRVSNNETTYGIKYDIKYNLEVRSCLIFYIERGLSILHIDVLSKCGPKHDLRSGTLLLNMIDALAGSIPECKIITLRDESTVRRCSHRINLAELSILLTGISWYNRFGYKQPSYESDNLHNNRIRNMRISDAVTELLASPYTEQYYPKFVKYKQQLDAMLTQFINADLTVTEYIKIMYDNIKPYPEDNCITRTNRNAKLVAYVINAFGQLLRYDNDVLTKQVMHGKYIPPFINPSTMSAFGFEPEDIFNCGECGRVLRGDDLPPWNAEPKGVKYYATRGEWEHAEMICHDCAAEEASRSQKAKSPRAAATSPRAAATSPRAAAKSPRAAAKSPRAAIKASSAPGGGSRTRRKPMRRTMHRKQMI